MFLITFSGTTVLLGLAGLCLFTAVAVFSLRGRLGNFNPLRITTPAFRFALFAAIACTFLAMNWAQTQGQTYVEMPTGWEEDIFTEVEIPPTATPPPPPPPPPPPVIEAVPDALIEEDVKMEDLGITPDDAVIAEPPVEIAKPTAPPPPPPPPPAPEPEKIPEIILVAEQMPVFGDACKALPMAERKLCSDRALLTFVQSRIKYPAIARENGIQGMVVVRFVVERDGSISGLESVRGVAGGCTEEALRAVRSITKEGETFLPGRQNGMPVRVMYNLPVRFKLE